MIIKPEQLGNQEFKKIYRLKYAYIAGSMYRGISSKEVVIAMGKAGFLGFLGTGGMSIDEMVANIKFIQEKLSLGEPYGMNLLCNLYRPDIEMKTVKLFLNYNISCIEASAFMQITPSLVLYRLSGLSTDDQGSIKCAHKIIAKVSRPEVAQAFMSPAPEDIVEKLVATGMITREQANLSRNIPMSQDICLEADSGGHTDQGVALVLLPSIQSLKKEMMEKFHYAKSIRIGLAGGIGTPQAAAAAFIMGADFILTGSINQCTVEARISDDVKNLLQEINIQDTDYVPAGDMFEIGAKVQVLKKGVFFPARANKLYMLYTQYGSLEQIPEVTKKQIEEKYFKKSFEAIWKEIRIDYLSKNREEEIQKAEQNPKSKMALTFRWYFKHSSQITFLGSEENRLDYQIHTGPALGAFNQWVKGTALESWRNRYVDKIAEKIMIETAQLLTQKFSEFLDGTR
jgi:trans-AT polyketide synthase/acyltransferase/oxidoreductase domain-containing protein